MGESVKSEESEVLTAARKYADAVRGTMNVQDVLMYGSQARGTATEDSDIDIAVVLDTLPDNYWDTLLGLWKLARSVDLRIEPVLLALDDARGGFLQTVQLTGIAV